MDSRLNASYGGQGRLSALRNSRSPPLKEHRATLARTNSRGKPTSPLRNKTQVPIKKVSVEERRMYELKR